MSKLSTLLCAYPLAPNLVAKLRTAFPTLHHYPLRSENDYSTASPPPLPPAEVYKTIDALVCFNLPPNLTHHTQTPKLRLLHCVGSGTNHITESEYYKSFPKENELVFSNSTGIHVPAISEHVLMTTMALTHKLQQIQDICRGEQRWPSSSELGPNGLFIRELRLLTVGILGYGHLGRESARLFKAFGSTILACTREGAPKRIGGYLIPGTGDPDGSLPDGYYSTGDRASLEAFLGRCDVVVNALPVLDSTRRFLGRKEFEMMKGTAIVVNIGRGETMDQEALVEALQAPGERTPETGTLHLGGAALDVTTPEPLPPKHPLFSMPNVVLTPHVSWCSEVNFERATEVLMLNKERLDAGKGVLNAIRGRGEFDE